MGGWVGGWVEMGGGRPTEERKDSTTHPPTHRSVQALLAGGEGGFFFLEGLDTTIQGVHFTGQLGGIDIEGMGEVDLC